MRLDERRGYLYAVSRETNELLFINKDSMQIDKRLIVGKSPEGMDMVDNRLYVALSGSTFIAVVNLDTGAVKARIPTKVKPSQVAVDGNSLYYSNNDQGSKIYRKNLKTGEEKVIENSISRPSLVVNRKTHKLYASETEIFSDLLTVFDSVSGVKQAQVEPDGNGFSNLVVNGGELYFGSLRLNPVNLSTISTTPGEIRAVDDAYIYSDIGIYTKDEGINVVKFANDFIMTTFMEVDHNHTIYSYNKWTSLLSKTNYNLPIASAGIEYRGSANRITFNRNLNAWAVGKEEKYLYAVSKESNRLLQIDSVSFKVIADRYIGSQPSDVDIDNGIIYVSLNGSTHLARIDTSGESNFMAPVTELEIGVNTTDIAAGNGKVYTANGNYWNAVGEFDDTYSNFPQSYNNPSLSMNRDKSLLYIGEADFSVSNLYSLDITTNTVLQHTNGGNGYGSKEVIPDGEYVYYAGQRFAADDLSKRYGVYKDGPDPAELLFARGKQVLGSTAIYDRDSFVPVNHLPFTASYGYIKQDGTILLYSGNGSQFALYKYDSLEDMQKEVRIALRPAAAYFQDDEGDSLSIDDCRISRF
ncbi:YncE family protein [Paenibacillus ihuae]|uniref:YncE family protein n=1 Tax=Paenibacillus ihuae TaxID=1232431 RepID=UPI0006D53F14|nr:hypothetical protein [Paenibacillus ihuae]